MIRSRSAGARAELESLLVPAPDDVVVHGDLHGLNVLRSLSIDSADGAGWKVIDPHANRGDRHADIWALIDPSTPPLADDARNASAEAWRRVELYSAAAGLDPQRAAVWARLRARAEALEIVAQTETASDDDRLWAARMHRMADALSQPRHP